MSFPTVVYGDEGLFYNDETTTKRHMLGTLGICPDGREFRYAEADTTATVAGRLYQSAIPDSNLEAENPTATSAVAATSVSMDVAATPTAADYIDGYLVDEANGHIYRVRSITAADPTVITIDNDDGLVTDLVAADAVALYKNPFKDILISPTNPTAPLAGLSVQAIAASSFGWVQTRGLAAVLTDTTTVIVGDGVKRSIATAGAVGVITGTNLNPVIGESLNVGGSGTIGTYFLFIG